MCFIIICSTADNESRGSWVTHWVMGQMGHHCQLWSAACEQ